MQCLLITNNNQQACKMILEHASKLPWLSFVCKPINSREAKHYLQEFNIDILFCDVATIADKEMDIFQDKYDDETDGSMNGAKQREWEKKITKEINDLKKFEKTHIGIDLN